MSEEINETIRQAVEPFLKGVTDLEGLLQVRELITNRIDELERAPKVYSPKKLDLRRFHLPKYLQAAVESEAEKIHNEWAALRIAQGWKYGPKRDDEKKEHPCLVPWEELPEEEKEYDRATALAAIINLLRDGWLILKRQAISHPDEYGWLDELQPELYPGLDPNDRFYELSDEEFNKLYGAEPNEEEDEPEEGDAESEPDKSDSDDGTNSYDQGLELNVSWGPLTEQEAQKIRGWLTIARHKLHDMERGDSRVEYIYETAKKIKQYYTAAFFMDAHDLSSEAYKKL